MRIRTGMYYTGGMSTLRYPPLAISVESDKILIREGKSPPDKVIV